MLYLGLGLGRARHKDAGNNWQQSSEPATESAVWGREVVWVAIGTVHAVCTVAVMIKCWFHTGGCVAAVSGWGIASTVSPAE